MPVGFGRAARIAGRCGIGRTGAAGAGAAAAGAASATFVALVSATLSVTCLSATWTTPFKASTLSEAGVGLAADVIFLRAATKAAAA